LPVSWDATQECVACFFRGNTKVCSQGSTISFFGKCFAGCWRLPRSRETVPIVSVVSILATVANKKALTALLIKFRREFQWDPELLSYTVKEITKPKLCTVFAF
jgi:hypothetical protein